MEVNKPVLYIKRLYFYRTFAKFLFQENLLSFMLHYDYGIVSALIHFKTKSMGMCKATQLATGSKIRFAIVYESYFVP